MRRLFRTLGLAFALSTVAPALTTGCATDTIGESTERYEILEGSLAGMRTIAIWT